MNAIWDLLTTAGGGLALSFIIGIVIGIAAVILLFTGSAVVVLEHFARANRSVPRLAAVSVAWSLLLAPLVFDSAFGEFAGVSWAEWWPIFAKAALVTLLLVFAAEVCLGLLLRVAPTALLGHLTALCLAASYALLVGGVGRPLLAATPALVLAAFLLVLGRKGKWSVWWRTGWISTATLGLGIALATFGQSPLVSQTGALLLLVILAAIALGLVPLAAAGFLETRGGCEWFIATRYLFAKRRQTLISVITAICVGGVAAGVWLIITVLSVMNGFERVWREEIIGNRAHFTVHNALGSIDGYRDVLATLDEVEGVSGASPYVDAEAMVRGPTGEIVGVRVRGIDPARIVRVTDLEEDLTENSKGALAELAPAKAGEGSSGTEPGAPDDSGGPTADEGNGPPPVADDPALPKDPPIIIGSQLASAFGLSIGDPLLVVVPFGGPQTPLGPGPRLKRFRLAGVFESSFFQYDEVYTYTSLAAAQDFRRQGDVITGVEVRTTDFYRSQRVAERAQAALEHRYYTRDWKEFFPAFFQALKTERVMMFVLLTMIMVVAAFAIVVTLIMMIMEKSSDIAILKTMGATDDSVERIFAIEGTLIGLLGTALGVIAGIAVTTQLAWVQSQIESLTGIDTLPAAIYQFSTLPWALDPGQIAIVVSIAMILSLGATLLPSRHGARLEPVEALRYE